MSPGKLTLGLIINIVLILLISYGTTGSLNPFQAFSSSNLLIKIVLIVLAFFTFIEFLFLLVISRIPEDAICQDPDCGKDIRTYYLVLRGAIRCPVCGRWYHRACWIRYNRTSSPLEILKGCKKCRGEGEMGRPRLLGEEDTLRG